MPPRPILPAVLVAALLLACADDGDASQPSPAATTASATAASATAARTPTATLGTPSPSPTTTLPPPGYEVPVHADDTRTGIEHVDRVLAAVLTGNAGTLRDLLVTHEEECTARPVGVGALQCPQGVADGTALEVFSVAGCEGGFAFPADLDDLVARLLEPGPPFDGADDPGSPPALYAVLEAEPQPYWLGAEHLVILAYPSGTGRALMVDEAGITGVWLGCGETAATQMISFGGTEQPEFVVPPVAG